MNLKQMIEKLKFAFNNWDGELDIQCQLTNKDAILPTKNYNSDSCFDLYLPKDIAIKAHEKKKINLNIAVQFPEGYGGQIRPRSSTELNYDLLIHQGTIDNGYTGEIQIICYNYGNKEITFNAGDRIAQLFIEKIIPSKMIEVKHLTKDTDRKNNGFGSSGN